MNYFKDNLDLVRASIGRVLAVHIVHRLASGLLVRGYYRVRPRLSEVAGSLLVHHFYGLFRLLRSLYNFQRRAKHALLRALR